MLEISLLTINTQNQLIKSLYAAQEGKLNKSNIIDLHLFIYLNCIFLTKILSKAEWEILIWYGLWEQPNLYIWWVSLSLNVLGFFPLECESHKFGPNCSSTCGHCKDGTTCSSVTGDCTGGCEYGWVGKQCDTGK